MSHVSQTSISQIRELILLTHPEIVAVELCKERLGLLVGSGEEDMARSTWHSRKVAIEGLPKGSVWPSEQQLLGILYCRSGVPISGKDIEGDVFTLLATGLFKSVRPICDVPTAVEAPQFVTPAARSGPAGPTRLQAVSPLGCIRFVVEERKLPAIKGLTVRLDSSLQGSAVTESDMDSAAASAVAASSSGTVAALLQCRAQLMGLFGSKNVVVTFKGAESGRVEAIVRAAGSSDPSYLSGLEASAPGSEGVGIDTFRPNRTMFKVSNRLFIPTEAIERMKAAQAQQDGSPPGASLNRRRLPVQTQTRAWSSDELASGGAAKPLLQPQVLADALSGLLTSSYSSYQAVASKKLGLEPGAAWRAAMEAATEAGSSQVLLIDRPSSITERRLATGVFSTAGWRLGGAASVALASLIGTLATSVLPVEQEVAVVAAGVLGAVALLWPLLAPILEISTFSELSPAAIEAAVSVPGSISEGDLTQPLKLYGEDALLDWPGAMLPVVEERDLFMAKALAAAATARPGVAPAFVSDASSGSSSSGPAGGSDRRVWRYMMPDGGTQGSAPAGLGDGAFEPLPGVASMVAVVGTAHVRGMIREWKACVANTDVTELLKVEGSSS
ncbi:MAG: hypothetical protein WDW38_000646 [Sanguina aurantia]